jgi:hypothetical protein
MSESGSFAAGAQAAALVTQMAVSTIACGGLGGWLDSRLSTGHGLLIAGALGGFATGMVALFRGLTKLTPGDDDERPPDPPE